jgi:hypothetical protein
MIVTGFGYLLTIVRPKTCNSTIRNHTNTLLPIKVKLTPMVTKMWVRSYPLTSIPDMPKPVTNISR